MRTTGPLTRRETEVIEHMADGLQNKEIAFALGISMSSVKTYQRYAFMKLGAVNRAEAVAILLRQRLAA